jgi:hypothetical protein
MAIAGEAEHKIIDMRKKITETLYYIFFIAAILLVLFRLYLKSNNRDDEAETVQWVTFGLLLAAVICRFIDKVFPKWFDNKPAREEIEERVHGDKRSES